MPSRPDVVARRVRALELRAMGVGYQQIAAQVGYKSRRSAAADVARALQDREVLGRLEAGLAAALEGERLDGLERAAQRVLREAATSGDHDTVLRAVDRLVRLSARRGGFPRPGRDGAAAGGPVEVKVRHDIGALITQHPMGEALAEMSLHLARTLDAGAGLATAAVNRQLRENLLELSRLAVDETDELDAELSAAVGDAADPGQG